MVHVNNNLRETLGVVFFRFHSSTILVFDRVGRAWDETQHLKNRIKYSPGSAVPSRDESFVDGLSISTHTYATKTGIHHKPKRQYYH
jgi:hypothetical protein